MLGTVALEVACHFMTKAAVVDSALVSNYMYKHNPIQLQKPNNITSKL